MGNTAATQSQILNFSITINPPGKYELATKAKCALIKKDDNTFELSFSRPGDIPSGNILSVQVLTSSTDRGTFALHTLASNGELACDVRINVDTREISYLPKPNQHTTQVVSETEKLPWYLSFFDSRIEQKEADPKGVLPETDPSSATSESQLIGDTSQADEAPQSEDLLGDLYSDRSSKKDIRTSPRAEKGNVPVTPVQAPKGHRYEEPQEETHISDSEEDKEVEDDALRMMEQMYLKAPPPTLHKLPATLYNAPKEKSKEELKRAARIIHVGFLSQLLDTNLSFFQTHANKQPIAGHVMDLFSTLIAEVHSVIDPQIHDIFDKYVQPVITAIRATTANDSTRPALHAAMAIFTNEIPKEYEKLFWQLGNTLLLSAMKMDEFDKLKLKLVWPHLGFTEPIITDPLLLLYRVSDWCEQQGVIIEKHDAQLLIIAIMKLEKGKK